MAVIRVNKNKDYTVMSNNHFRNKDMSLKAKGLLSLMLSLPDDWDYSINGLVSICKEQESAIKATLSELKELGYLIIRKQMPNETDTGRFEYIYDIYEYPKQGYEKQAVENQPLEIQPIEKQAVENPTQLNTNILNTNISNTNISSTEKKSASAPADISMYEYYVDKMGMITPQIKQGLDVWLTKVDSSLIKYAIDEAVRCDKKSWAYIKAILNGQYESGRCYHGVNTVEFKEQKPTRKDTTKAKPKRVASKTAIDRVMQLGS